MIQTLSTKSEENVYRDGFIDFIAKQYWHWMVTIGIGHCPSDEELLRRLRIIEAQLCGKYLSNSYHKLLDIDRYSMLVGFEGERTGGSRHAHILVHVPKPTKRHTSQALSILRFEWEFWTLWLKFNDNYEARLRPNWLVTGRMREIDVSSPQTNTNNGRIPVQLDRIGHTADRAKAYYAVKRVRSEEASWTDVQFVTPPKFKKFENANTRKIHNLHRSVRLKLNRVEHQVSRL